MGYQSRLYPFETDLLILKPLCSFSSFSQSQYFAVASLQRMEDEVAVKIGIRGCEEVARRWDDGVHSSVRQIVINHEKWIYSVNVEYDKNGESIWKPKHGGNKGSTSKVVLDYPKEYLISIHGYYSDIGHIIEKKAAPGTTVIRSLTLENNRKTYGLFGMEEGTNFSFPIMEAKIMGFHGSSGWFLDAIGIYVQPISQYSQPQPQPQSQVEVEVEVEHFSLREYGGEGGEPWIESFQAIKQLVIHNDEQWIVSIQMEYEDENGDLVWSPKHGGDGGSRSEVVLEFRDEHLVSIHGYYKDLLDSKLATIIIGSLTLETNRKIYGPFGVEDGTKFFFPTSGLKIVGIQGRSSLYLNAIGLLAKSIQD